MIVMDRENLYAKGWSHVLSTAGDIEELDAFRRSVGAPVAALQLANKRWPHLDLRGGPRERALIAANVRIFDGTMAMMRFLRGIQFPGSR